jgi:hypothetical protein
MSLNSLLLCTSASIPPTWSAWYVVWWDWSSWRTKKVEKIYFSDDSIASVSDILNTKAYSAWYNSSTAWYTIWWSDWSSILYQYYDKLLFSTEWTTNYLVSLSSEYGDTVWFNSETHWYCIWNTWSVVRQSFSSDSISDLWDKSLTTMAWWAVANETNNAWMLSSRLWLFNFNTIIRSYNYSSEAWSIIDYSNTSWTCTNRKCATNSTTNW